MEGKVVKAFWDMQDPKRTTYNVGDTYTGTDERIAGLAEKGFVEPIVESVDAEESKPKRAQRRKADKE